MKMRSVAGVLGAVVLLLALVQWWRYCHRWPEWQAYQRVFIQADGRVIDRTAADRTTSEGQAYSLFFALIANDQKTFDRLLLWTARNLADGDLSKKLPAWLWGKRDDGSWGIKDANPASDADLWIAYTLLEAARLWQRPALRDLGLSLLAQVKRAELVNVPGLGSMLLPAPHGFVAENGEMRFNPSYLPQFQFQALQQHDPAGPWAALWANHHRAMQGLLQTGVAPDWYRISAAGEILPDAITQGVGSYDAIRVYLWAGMTPATVNSQHELLPLLGGFAKVLQKTGAPPERIDPPSLRTWGGAPIGFSAAVLPFLARLDEDSDARHRQRLKNGRVEGNLGVPPHYYDQVLALFGEGWSDGRFRFGVQGQVIPRWQSICCEFMR